MVTGIRNARPGLVAATFSTRCGREAVADVERECRARGAVALWWFGPYPLTAEEKGETHERVPVRTRKRTGMKDLNLTPLRLRILSALDQRGEMDLQEIGYEFATSRGGAATAFKHPASATRFGGMLVAPLRRAGLVRDGSEKFAHRRKIAITAAGGSMIRTENTGE